MFWRQAGSGQNLFNSSPSSTAVYTVQLSEWVGGWAGTGYQNMVVTVMFYHGKVEVGKNVKLGFFPNKIVKNLI